MVDARFHLTFAHPRTVREGEAYSLFVTVTNLSRATQNLITVALEELRITGAHKADPLDEFSPTIETLAPGASSTLEFRLVADVTGAVIASTFQSSDVALTGTIRLRAGVGEVGIPLSPATLILPRFTERLKPPFTASDAYLKETVRLLGLAWSLAVSPASLTPPGLPRVVTGEVERRALDLGEAGQRTFLHEPLLESLEGLLLDQLGNRAPLAEYDALRRLTDRGLRIGVEMAALLRAEQTARGLDAEALLDHWAETHSYRDPFVLALLVPDDPGALDLLGLELLGSTPDGTPGGMLAQAGDGASPRRGVAFGELLAIHDGGSGDDAARLAIVGRLESGQQVVASLVNDGLAPLGGQLVVVAPRADGSYRKVDLGRLVVPPGERWGVTLGAGVPDPSGGGFELFDLTTGAAVPGAPATARTEVALPPFRVIGAVQDTRIGEEGPDPLGNVHRPNRHGHGVAYLFNRPPERASAEVAGSYRIRSTWSGLDAAGAPASSALDKTGTAAWVQDSERVVLVRYSSPIASMVDDGGPLVGHAHPLDTGAISDRFGYSPGSTVPPVTLETAPLHVGGLVGGRVVRGDGQPAVGATVELLRPRVIQTLFGVSIVSDLVGRTTADAQGEYAFDFVEQPHWDVTVQPAFRLRATTPAGPDPELQPAETMEVGSVVRQQNRMARVNIAFLGRGTVSGRLVWLDDGAPVAGGTVRATSDLFDEDRHATVGADGSFRFVGLPVGPITLTGADGGGRKVYATVGVERSGAVVEVTLRLPRLVPPDAGTVRGVVLRRTREQTLEQALPVEGARVHVWSDAVSVGVTGTDGLGRFALFEVPAGRVSVQAADWQVSRTAAFTDVTLSPGHDADVTLVLVEGATRRVHGRVELDDPFGGGRLPISGAAVFVAGPGNFAFTDALGEYVIEGVPVQGGGEDACQVTAIDFERKLEGAVALPAVLDVSPETIEVQTIVLREMRGGIDGVVLDALGRPAAFVEVIDSRTLRTAITGADGTFSFDDLAIGRHTLTAHVGDGLALGQVGTFGAADADIVLGGHRPYVTLRMVGSGRVAVHTRTGSASVQTPIYYRPTYFSSASKAIQLRGALIESTTDPNGRFELELPVGAFEIYAYNPFHGVREVRAAIEYQGQVVDVDVLFEDAATVTGTVLDVDGITPVPHFEVQLHTEALLPQTQRTAADGSFRFELVPQGRVAVIASGFVGAVERVGRTDGVIGTAGQELELAVRLEVQGTVRGRVLDDSGAGVQPVAGAQVFVTEQSFPYRRLPADGGFFFADSEGRYEVAHLYAGSVRVVARDPLQVARSGATVAEITADWQVVDAPDIVLQTLVGRLEVLVRDPGSGAPVADAQVWLQGGEQTVSDAEGRATFDALPLGTWSIYAFDAPTGRSGRLGGVVLSQAGQVVSPTVYLDQRGEVRGTLFDDDAMFLPVAGATVELSGVTSNGPLRALATTGGGDGDIGRFAFAGIPEGSFDVVAAPPTSPRRARATVALTETAPIADLVLFLEPVRDVHVRLFEALISGLSPVDAQQGDFSVRLRQASMAGSALGPAYDYTQSLPVAGSDVFRFPDVLSSRAGSMRAQEVGGELRAAGVSFAQFESHPPVPGSGTFADPYRLTLGAKGVVRVRVVDALGAVVGGAPVTLRAGSATFPSVSGSDGSVTFFAVPAGSLSASAADPATGLGGVARGTLTYDDEAVELVVTLAAAVSARGVVYQPIAEGVDPSAPSSSTLVPQEGAIVTLTDAAARSHVAVTGALGAFHFDGLAIGSYAVQARDANGDGLASRAGSLAGPQGTLHELGAIVLDAAPPRLVSIVPPPGLEGVSRSAPVEVTFSEPLAAAVLPTGQATASHFSLVSASGAAAVGTWSSFLEGTRQVVRFVPSTPYENQTLYSLRISGGPGGVRDLEERPLTASGEVGSTFRTSDGIGPAVIGTLPALDQPVDPSVAIRVDFNEEVSGPASLFDGDGVGDAAALYWERDPGTGVLEWAPLPVTLTLTRLGYSLAVQPVGGLALAGDTLRRRLVVSGLADSAGNVMAPDERVFRVWDGSAPVIVEVPVPEGAPDGRLLPGNEYAVAPILAGLDEVTAEAPFGDLGRVEYYLEDPAGAGAPPPAFVAQSAPFAFGFVAAYVGDGVTARPFPVWVRAVDTSANASNVVRVDLEVKPNEPPTLGAVEVTAVTPAEGTFYAGSLVRATVHGVADADANQLTLRAELLAQGGAEIVGSQPGRLLQRPAGGWAELPAQSFDFTLPLARPEGEPLFVRVELVDPQGGKAALDSSPFVVADDAAAPGVTRFEARLVDGSSPAVFFIGRELRFEVEASDAETAVKAVTVTVDRTDLLASPLVAAPVPGSPGLYRTEAVTVPASAAELTEIAASVAVEDWGGNTAEETMLFDVGPEPDPQAPEPTWLTPWIGAEWPAGYSSVLGGGATDLLLRAAVTDTTLDGNDQVVPGTIAEVAFRGPLRAAGGELELAANWTPGRLVAGSGAPGAGTFELLWPVPDDVPAGTELRFEVRAIDTGGLVSTVPARLLAAPARWVVEGAQTAVLAGDPMIAPGGDPGGAVFLLDGSTVSLFPPEDGSIRQLDALFVYAGGDLGSGSLVAQPSVLTVPEITSYASAIQYYPLELEVARAIGVGAGARIDVSERGLLGNSCCVEMVLPGETRAEGQAGGSHGGAGWYGYRDSTSSDYDRPGSVYDSVRDPLLPGSGGSYPFDGPGGAGGGVVRLLAPGATVHLAGDLLADGVTTQGGGGAGGTIRLAAGRLGGAGTISASGADAVHGFQWDLMGSGGGGRISISYAAVAEGFDLESQVRAHGGDNRSRISFQRVRQAAAGTVYLEQIDAVTAEPLGSGELVVRNGSTFPSAATLLPALGEGSVAEIDPDTGTVLLEGDAVRGSLVGEELILTGPVSGLVARLAIAAQAREVDPEAVGGVRARLGVEAEVAELEDLAALLAVEPLAYSARHRYSRVRVEGAARLAVDDGLELLPPGETVPVLDDRGLIELGLEARAALRGETPVVGVATTPTAGVEILPGATIDVSWTVSDLLGLEAVETEWTLDGAPVVLSYGGTPTYEWHPTAVERTLQLEVPSSQAPGVPSYRVTASDLGKRVTTTVATWTVLGDTTPPAITIDFTPAAEGDLYTAGDGITVTATAVDDVEVATLAVTIGGETVSGPSPLTVPFTVPPLAAPTDFEVGAVATDLTGNVASALRTLHTQPLDNAVPPAVEVLCPSPGALLPPAQTITVGALATDDLGGWSIELSVLGAAEPFAVLRPALGTPTLFEATTTWTTPEVASEQTVTLELVAVDAAGNRSLQALVPLRIKPAVALLPDGAGTNDWSALENQAVYLAPGLLTLDAPRRFEELILLEGARLTHPEAVPGDERPIDLAVSGSVYVACGAAIDVSVKGYAQRTTHPDAAPHSLDAGGSHVGEGSGFSGTLAETFGSVERPVEMGGGGNGARGGGGVHLTASELVLDGAIRANGGETPAGQFATGGAGGSVWIELDGLAGGRGSVEARGGVSGWFGRGSGGGGAVSVAHGGAPAGSWLERLSVAGGQSAGHGAAGSRWLRGPGEVHGTLSIDQGEVASPVTTVLPSFGAGAALAGTVGATLVTDRTEAIESWFVGHWVEVRDGVSGALEGTWRIASIDGVAFTLAPNDGEAIALDEGDRYQGVYRVDTLTVSATSKLRSVDPIRLAGVWDLGGRVEVSEVVGIDLMVRSGAILASPAPGGLEPTALRVQLTGTLVVEAGGAIDVSGHGYGLAASYPGARVPTDGAGGSHLAPGGWAAPLSGTTYGSVYRPAEAGGGGTLSTFRRGGGTLFLEVAGLVVDGAIRANGGASPASHGGAGGSIWIRAVELSGTGVVEANGSRGNGGGGGGGGAIAIEYASAPDGTIPVARAHSDGEPAGGAGTVFWLGPEATWGDLLVDGNGLAQPQTELPGLGSGVAQEGSAGGTLVVDRSDGVAPFFVGHWVEVRSPSGELEGTYRVAGIDGARLDLANPGGGLVDVTPGDQYQGVYHFDQVSVTGGAALASYDPIRVAGAPWAAGTLVLTELRGHDVVIPAGTTLTHPPTVDPANPQRLEIDVTGTLTIEAGAVIDVSNRGFGPGMTWPGHQPPGFAVGGCHVGAGARWFSGSCETFGSVERPLEPGGGSQGSAGGGVVHLRAARLVLDGDISSNGASGGFDQAGGAGGSVWIEVGALSGGGSIEARGGNGWSDRGGGGGGAIAVEYGTSSGTVLSRLSARGGSSTRRRGGAGSIWIREGDGEGGTLIVDNDSLANAEWTEPAWLGVGTAQPGSAGATLVTEDVFEGEVPSYFVGHWIEIRDSNGALKGRWRIEAIHGSMVTLAPSAYGTPDAQVGDRYRGVFVLSGLDVRERGILHLFDLGQVGGPATVHGAQLSTRDLGFTSLAVIDSLVEAENLRGDAVSVVNSFVWSWDDDGDGPYALEIDLTGDLTIDKNSDVDVSWSGYRQGVTRPGRTFPGAQSGGSHLGAGGLVNSPIGETYGSVYRPREFGSGGQGRAEATGGGALRIAAENVHVDGNIFAQARWSFDTSDVASSAGGSIWLSARGRLSGDGWVDARSWDAFNAGAGGGGAISIEYGSVEGTVLQGLTASGAPSNLAVGGAGTLYLRGPDSVHGDLIVSNFDRWLDRPLVGGQTVLPSFGTGVAAAGSENDLLISDRASIEDYFVGHWIEVYDATGTTLKGTGRIAAVLQGAVLLDSDPVAPISVAPGDFFQGVYHFDSVTVVDGAELVSIDPIRVELQHLETAEGTVRSANEEAPRIDRRRIRIVRAGAATGLRTVVVVPPDAIDDRDGVEALYLTDGKTTVRSRWDRARGAELTWHGPVRNLRLLAVDGHPVLRRGAEVRIGAAAARGRELVPR
ncbi:MAG TPA: Ig-like domain-containing protein [Acidimicrobiia bacterium]|nr:Ig-like domain-containing protein [Acidimicrobiia bacterium]